MRRKRFVTTFAVSVAASVALMATATAGASVGTPLTISGQTTFGSPGTFQTSPGSGLCATGATSDGNIGQLFSTGGQSNRHIIFHDQKTFTCDDGSGTFTMNLQVMLVFGNPTDSFSWRIVSGTGAYTNLHGTGSGVGLEGVNEVADSYTGSVFFS
jgi:hypothetical protein